MALAVVLITPARLDRQAADNPTPTANTEAVDSGTATADAGSRRQQVQFATENGTRIIWDPISQTGQNVNGINRGTRFRFGRSWQLGMKLNW